MANRSPPVANHHNLSCSSLAVCLMGHSTPFAKDPFMKEMHRCTIDHICRPSFAFTLPKLDTEAWKVICTDPRARERLEFLGDSLIGANVSEGLIHLWPSETPDFYTKCRTILVANSTFAYLMWKAGISKLDKNVKPAGDAFEAILALYHEKHGLKNFKRYIYESFGPLFKAVGESYHQNFEKSRISHKKRHQMQLHDRRLNQAAKSAKEMASPVYRRHDSRSSMKLILVNKKQRIYENQSPQKTLKKPTTARAAQSQPEIRQRNVVELTQKPHDCAAFSSVEDVPSNGSIAVKPEPSSPTLNFNTVQMPPPPTTEFVYAPMLPHKPLPYPTFTPKQIIDSQTRDILITASKAACSQTQNPTQNQKQTQKQMQPPPPPLQPNRNNTGPPPPPKHRRVASGTADELADMFASRATLAQDASVPLAAPAAVRGTKDNPISILDDDD